MYKKNRDFEMLGIMEYEQEKAERAAVQKLENERKLMLALIQDEMDQMWDEYRAEQQREYDRIQMLLEREYDYWLEEQEFAEQLAMLEEIELYEAEVSYIWDDDFYVEAPVKLRADRRRKSVVQKRHRLNIANIMDSRSNKDACEDMLNFSFTLKRGGHRVDNPKSLTKKAEMFQYRVKKENPEYESETDSMKDYWHSDKNHPQRAVAKMIKDDVFGISMINLAFV